MMNPERGFRRLTWAISLTVALPLVVFGMYFLTQDESQQDAGYVFALLGLGAFGLAWGVFFVSRWVVMGFRSESVVAVVAKANDTDRQRLPEPRPASEYCPRCGFQNPPESARCSCGYDFTNPAPTPPGRTNWLWPRIVDRASARKTALEGVASAGWVTFVTTALATSNVFFGTDFGKLSALAYVDALVFTAIGLAIYKMSRVAAVSGLVLYCYEQWYMHLTRGSTLNTVIVLIIALGFVNSVRGTFAFHRFTEAQSAAPSTAASPAKELPPSRLRTVECWRCRSTITVTAETAGRSTTCPSCGTAQNMPRP